MPIAAALDVAIALFKRWRWLIMLLPVLVLSWQLHRTKSDLGDCRAKNAEILAANDANLKAVIQQRNDAEKVSAQNAKDSQYAYEKGLAAGRAYADRFISANRLHQNSLRGGTAATAAEGADSSVPQGLPADAVMVSERDVQVCSAATVYAIEAHNNARKKVEAGQAEWYDEQR